MVWPPWMCRVFGHTLSYRHINPDSTMIACLRCGAERDGGDFCPSFVPWSAWDIEDPAIDECDVCGCPRKAHPVRTPRDAEENCPQ